eukprot:Skav205160  [mRNA]  locus=scaffold2749:16011:23433:+ [translate_table: standard]
MRKWEEKRMHREEEIQRRVEKALKLAQELGGGAGAGVAWESWMDWGGGCWLDVGEAAAARRGKGTAKRGGWHGWAWHTENRLLAGAPAVPQIAPGRSKAMAKPPQRLDVRRKERALRQGLRWISRQGSPGMAKRLIFTN